MENEKKPETTTMAVYPGDKTKLKKLAEKLHLINFGDTEADLLHKILEQGKE